MELGTAILLSTITLSMILLYGFTKDLWNWAKVVAVFFSVFACLALLLALYGNLEQEGDSFFRSENYPQLPSEVDGISLGMSRSDVLFRLGEPWRRRTWKRETDAAELEMLGYTIHDNYESSHNVVIELYEGRVIRVARSVNSPEFSWGPIQRRGGVDALISALGGPAKLREFKGGIFRVYNFEDKNLAVSFYVGEIQSIALYKPELYPEGGITLVDVESED